MRYRHDGIIEEDSSIILNQERYGSCLDVNHYRRASLLRKEGEDNYRSENNNGDNSVCHQDREPL